MTTIPHRRRLPATRPAITHKAQVCGMELFVIVGFFDGPGVTVDEACQPAEVFLHIAKHGSDTSGIFDGLCVTISLALQYGVPWQALRDKYVHTRFGTGNDPDCPSVLHGFALMVDHCLEERRRMLGDEGGAGAGALVPTEPKGPEPIEAAAPWPMVSSSPDPQTVVYIGNELKNAPLGDPDKDTKHDRSIRGVHSRETHGLLLSPGWNGRGIPSWLGNRERDKKEAMKFRITVEGRNGQRWTEDYEREVGEARRNSFGTQPEFKGDPVQWGKEIVEWFNEGSPKSDHRKFISAEVLS